jgi:23S rRNA pseudouridine1911/1915/1917 synthase
VPAVAEERTLAVPEGLDGERIDVALSRLLGLSRTKSADLVVGGHVDLDGRPAQKGDRVSIGQVLAIRLPEPAAAPEPIAHPGLTIVYEDGDLIVVDKPAGVAAHPSPGWDGPTVIGGLAAQGFAISTSGAAERQGVVHRLDVGTTGLMAVAKTDMAYADLKRQFKERTVAKVYRAIVQGHLDPLSGTIDAPIGRHPSADWRMAVVAGGRPSITHYDTLEAFAHASLAQIELETGRTHQIRVHMSAVRHPCVGDLTYGADPRLAERLGMTRQALHAARLELDSPSSRQRLQLHAPDPQDIAEALRRLGGVPTPL